MKKLNILKYAVALCVSAFCLMFLPVVADAQEVRDEKNGVIYADELYIGSGVAGAYAYGGAGTVKITLSESGDRVKNVKSKNKNLLAQITAEGYQTNISKKGTSTIYNETHISFFGKKKGTYTVTFDVVDKNGKKKCTKKIKVYVDKYPVSAPSPIKSVKYAGKDINSYYPFASVKKGKLKVSVRKGYKIEKIDVKKRNAKGDWVYTKIRNGAKITLSKREKYTIQDDWQTIKINALFPETQIEIRVRNKKTNESYIYAYSVFTLSKK